MIAFSKERVEDEYVEHLRMRSLVWALKVNTISSLSSLGSAWYGLYNIINALNVQHIPAVSLPFSVRTT